MISPELFRGRGFGPAVGVNAVAMFAMAGFTVFSTQYMQLVLGKSPLEAALWCLIPSVAVGGAAPAATALVRKGVDRAYVIGGGFAVAAVGYLAALAAGATSGIWVILVSAGIVAVGIVTVMSLITDLALDTAPPHRSSSAAALLETGQEFGAALGTAVLGSLGTAFYRHDVTDAVPATLPPETFRTVHETLGNALAAAGHLPSPMASAVATAARGAFTTGMHAAAVGAAVAVTAGGGAGTDAAAGSAARCCGNGPGSGIGGGHRSVTNSPAARSMSGRPGPGIKRRAVASVRQVDRAGRHRTDLHGDLGQDRGRDRLVDRQRHQRLAALDRAGHLHARDVDARLAEDAAHRADDARPVAVAEEGHVLGEGQVHVVVADRDDLLEVLGA
ncbi:hypothetical protein GCM10020000_23820 [Streptomyces olivoverticillatus]